MNILVPFSWLSDFLKTNASAEKTAEALSLCSQSVEKIHQQGDDQILEIEITVNRYDCLSIIGIAREAAAILPHFNIKAKFVEPKIKPILKFERKNEKHYLEVEIKDKTVCPRFSAILIDSVKVGPSPKWMAERLNKVGIRSLNNVVDISNYLMIETGQPIHTFDYDKILGKKMIMRLSRQGEKITTLDGVERTLPGGDIIIEDGKGRLIDLCGIMGGKNSEIDENTKRVLFFVQAYDPARIRKTSMSIGLRTEAAARFERGIDLEGILPVIERGVELMDKLAGGKVGGELIDIYPKKQTALPIKVNLENISKILGVKIETRKIVKILSDLGFKIEKRGKNSAFVKVPSWRTKDISLEEDIAEEVARVYGYFRLQGKIPPINEYFGLISQPAPKKGTISPNFKWEETAKDILKASGFTETYNFSFISKNLIQKSNLDPAKHLKLKNPLTIDFEYMRTSLIPSLLEVFSKNLANFSKISIFEMANVYLPKEKDLPEEKIKLAGITNNKNFYEIKGILVEILKELGIFDINIKPAKKETIELFWQKEATGQIFFQNLILGTIGQISNEITKNFLLNQKIYGFDLDFKIIESFACPQKIFIPIPKYPPIIEDLAFIFSEKIYVGEVLQSIKAIDSLIKGVDLIDTFDKTKTLRITYQHPERSLTDKEVKSVREKIVNLVGKKFGGNLKG